MLTSREQSVKSRRYNLNESYFDQIDSPQKAYILGLIYADGNLMGTRLKIALQESDRELLEQCSKEFDSDRPIYFEPSSAPTRCDMAVLIVQSVAISEALRKLGVTEQKTSRIEVPTNLSDELLRSFLLGYFDGDGCVTSYIGKDKSFRFSASFAGHEGFILELREVLHKRVGVRGTFTKGKGKGRALIFNCISGLKILNFLYSNRPGFLLNRKFQRYATIANTLQANRRRKALKTRPHIDEALQIILANAA